MLSVPRPIYRPRRGHGKPSPPPAALTLVTVTLDKNRAWVRLTFDQPVVLTAAGGVTPQSVWVNVGTTQTRYVATGVATLLTASSVRVTLAPGGSQSAPGTALSTSAETGIAAADDGRIWAGVWGLALPFPATS